MIELHLVRPNKKRKSFFMLPGEISRCMVDPFEKEKVLTMTFKIPVPDTNEYYQLSFDRKSISDLQNFLKGFK